MSLQETLDMLGMPKIRQWSSLISPKGIQLGIGQPLCPMPEQVRDDMVRSLSDSSMLYPPTQGLPALRDVAAQHSSRDIGRSVAREQVLITNGAAEGIFLALMCVCATGDRILIPDPGYPAYRAIAEIIGLRVDTYQLDAERGWDAADSFHVPWDTRAVVINAPSNPTGMMLSDMMAKVIAAKTTKAGAYVLCDDSYLGLYLHGKREQSVARFFDPDRTIVISSVSKPYAMMGMRVGWTVASELLTARMAAYHGTTMSCVNLPGQYAAISALTHDPDDVRERLRMFRIEAMRYLHSIEGLHCTIPHHGLFLYVDVGRYGDAEHFARRLAREYDVAVVPGTVFGTTTPTRIRVSFGAGSAALAEGFGRMKAMCGCYV